MIRGVNDLVLCYFISPDSLIKQSKDNRQIQGPSLLVSDLLGISMDTGDISRDFLKLNSRVITNRSTKILVLHHAY